MPVCLLQLIELKPYSISSEAFVERLLKVPKLRVVLASHIRFNVVKASKVDVEALGGIWHLFYFAEGEAAGAALPASLATHVARSYSVWTGVPSRLLKIYAETDEQLKNAPPPELTGSLDEHKREDSAQKLELSDDLEKRGALLSAHYTGPVTQLNLLHFNTGKAPQYIRYGQEFAKVGGRRGGNPKIVGMVVPAEKGKSADSSNGHSGEGEGGWWNQIALVHYPSIQHFFDMLAGKDYQEINQKHRIGALRDTVLMCTTEFDLDKLRRSSAKL